MDQSGYFDNSKFLSEKIGKSKRGDLLHRTACMDPKLREAVALLDYLKEEHPERKEKYEKRQKLLTFVGQARWPRDVISDMGLFTGTPPKRRGSFKL
jgi:hypothetical protein